MTFIYLMIWSQQVSSIFLSWVNWSTVRSCQKVYSVETSRNTIKKRVKTDSLIRIALDNFVKSSLLSCRSKPAWLSTVFVSFLHTMTFAVWRFFFDISQNSFFCSMYKFWTIRRWVKVNFGVNYPPCKLHTFNVSPIPVEMSELTMEAVF